jgi:hypothetical protein
MAKPKIIVDQRFGRLVAIKPNGKNKHGQIQWLCRCDCGEFHRTGTLSQLRGGRLESCGCNQYSGLGQYRHGGRHTRLYHVWCSMIQRCTNSKCKAYPDYGGRGIKVFDHWRDFINYQNYILATLGERPSEHHSLDRIDNDGNYELGNMQWATRSEQMKNRRGSFWNGRPRNKDGRFT